MLALNWIGDGGERFTFFGCSAAGAGAARFLYAMVACFAQCRLLEQLLILHAGGSVPGVLIASPDVNL